MSTWSRSCTGNGRARRGLRWGVVAGLVLLASACSDPPARGESSGAVGQQVDEAEDAAAPVAPTGKLVMDPGTAAFVEGECPFEPPPDTSPRCGTVTVPENWGKKTAGWVRLAVAVFPGPSDYSAYDPVVYLSGGPGQSSLDSLRGLMEVVVRPLQGRGDVVLFDQRGVGYTTPSLDCYELSYWDLTQFEGDDLEPTRFEDSVRECRSRLIAEGIDTTAYNSINSAHDVEAIRVALRYVHWNLYGVSYGTKLALEVARQHPDGVRTMVLDSVYPPEVDPVRDLPANVVATYEAIVDACNNEPACGADGDLAERVQGVVSTYDAEPVDVTVQDYVHDRAQVVRVTGELVVAVVTAALSTPFQAGDLPELITELESGHTAALGQYLSRMSGSKDQLSIGVLIAFGCNEEVPFADAAGVAAALPVDPFGRSSRFDYHAVNVGLRAFELCEAFGLGTPDPTLNQPVVTNLPTLLLAGENDPLTPVSWAREAARHLSSSYVVVLPSQGHGASFGTCGMDTILYFLGWPSVKPHRACLDAEPMPFVASPEVTAPELGPARYPSAVGSGTVSTLQPQGWVRSGGGEIAWRYSTFLDPTMVYQVAGDPVSAGQAEVWLSHGWGIDLSDPEPVLRGERRWLRRRGSGDFSEVEWYQTEVNDFTVTVVLMASPLELPAMIRNVLEPALDEIDVSG
jgi:pimeloyl-ACP methyl ester carboxylesterase